MASDKYIIVTDSRNLGDDKTDDTTDTQKEGEASSRRVLEEQGIFLDQTDGDSSVASEPQDEFSKKLQEMSGIEIIAAEDEDINY